MPYIKIASTDEFNDGEMKRYEVDTKELLVARVNNNFFVVDNRCPHMGENLSEGTLEGTILTCPRHHSQFDIKDGRVIRWTDWSGIKLTLAKKIKKPQPLSTYEVRIEEEKIMVKF